jgi:hypothetical protein
VATDSSVELRLRADRSYRIDWAATSATSAAAEVGRWVVDASGDLDLTPVDSYPNADSPSSMTISVTGTTATLGGQAFDFSTS